jgi:hypothetical protein
LHFKKGSEQYKLVHVLAPFLKVLSDYLICKRE